MLLKRLFVLLALTSGACFAQNNYYISTAGSDSNNGLTSGSPWHTFAHANSAIALGASGTVVHVAAGAYTEVIHTTRSGNASARITWVSDAKWGAKLTAPSGTIATWQNDGDYTTEQDFEISGPACRGILHEGGHQLAIGNHVHNDAVGCDTGSNSSRIGSGAGINDSNYAKCCNQEIGNYVHDVGMVNASCQNHTNQTVHGIYSGLPGPGAINNNLIVRNCDNGIDLAELATNYMIVNNTSLYNREGINVEAGPCVLGLTTCVMNNVLVYNNITAYNYHWGLVIDSNGGGSSVGTGNQFSYNLSFGNTTGDFDPYGSAGGVSCTPGCITGHNPLFVNNTGTALGDYHLQSTSPAIGAGTTTYAPSTDFDGIGRSAPITIGAYQGVGGATSPPSISAFTASPSTITVGGSSNLALVSSGGTSCSISGVGPVACNGTTLVTPPATTTYRATVTNLYGSPTRDATVTVNPVVTFTPVVRRHAAIF